MKYSYCIKNIFKKTSVVALAFSILSSSFLPYFNLKAHLSPYKVYAEENSCATQDNNNIKSSNKALLSARVGGVALDQAATFLSNMTEYTGAYYDASLDRIVFIGKTNTSTPQFDKDDLAISIKAIFFNNTIPAVSLESKPADTNHTQNMDVKMYGGIEDTRFGQFLLDADYKLKQYAQGYDINNIPVASSVPTYKSVLKRYIELGPDPTKFNSSRWWIVPDLVSLKKDDPSQSFVFDTVKMKVRTEAIKTNNAPTWNQAAQDFANDQTTNYDLYAQETPEYFKVKQLAKIVGVVKWMHDSGISTDMNWAREYAPKYQATPREMPRLTTPWVNGGDGFDYNMSGGIQYDTGNSYNPDTGIAISLKISSQSVPTTKENIHWTFTNNGQQYESVAVAADAFRSLGSYSTSATDMSFPLAGDLNLEFSRAYSSYSGGQQGVGRGWSMFPVQLFDNKPDNPTWRAYCTGETLSHRYKLAFHGQGGLHETFTWTCPNGFAPDDNAYHSTVFDSADRTFITVRTKDQTQYVFKEEFSGSTFKLQQIKDKNGNSLSYNYDSFEKLISITDNKNHTITLSYNPRNLISSISDWSGRTVNYTYDDQGNLLTVTDPNGGITTYAYDINFKLISIKDREGKVITENTYTIEAKLATQKNAANITNSFNYDTTNKTLTVNDNQTPSRSQLATYDAKARILQQTDPLSNNIAYTYGNEFAPLTIKDKNGNTITNTYDPNGNLTSVTYPDLKNVSYEYDVNNRITKIIDQRYGITPKQTTFTYDSSGNLMQINEAGITTAYTYDLSGEMLSLTDPLLHKTAWTRDSFGNKLTEKDALLKTTTFEYDAIARLTKKLDANTKSFSFTYDNNGNLLTQIDAAGITTNVYDKENRLTKVTLPDNTVSEFTYSASGALSSTKDPALSLNSYGYDAYQNLISQTDALNKITLNNYDALNRQTQSTTPLGKLYKYEYDSNGNITKRTDASNNATSYLYDAFNRLTKITYPNASIVTFTYDNRGNRTQMADSVGTSTYIYDNFDRLTQATNAYGKVLQYTYDNANNLKTIKYPDNGIVTYAYDNNNRLISVKDWNNKITTYTYNNNGTIATRQLPNTVKTAYAYDAANRLASITHTKSTTTLAKYNYTRDSVGNIKIATESGSFVGTAQTIKYDYDALGRITKATYPGNKTFEYVYDKMGNRLMQKVNGSTTTAYTYDDDYKLTQKNSFTSYTYDNNGNQTKKPSENFNPDPTFTFDFENRLTGHTTSTGNVYDWKYDGLGNRLRKNMSTAATRYIYDTNGSLSKLMATSGDQNFASTFWIYGIGLLYDTDSNYYLEDGTGSMRFIANGSGFKRSGANYDPFGNIRSSSGALPDFQFNTQQLDSGSNLYFLRARYYDPTLGRFISRDPVKGYLNNPQSQSPYSYSLNNPINLSDPSGKDVYGGCIGGSVGLAVYGTCSVCIVYSTNEKKLGIAGTLGGGGTTGFNLGVGPQLLYSNAKSFSDFSGQDAFGGGSYGEILTFGGDISQSIDNPNVRTYSAGPSLETNVSLPFPPAEFHGGSTYTWTLVP